METHGKVALITGSSRGIGLAAALALAREGCSIALNYSRSREEAEQAAQQIRTLGKPVVSIQADVSDDQACRQMAEEVFQQFGGIHILVNNAATTRFIPHSRLDDLNAEVWDRIFAVNVRGSFQCTRAVRPFMEKSGGGEIINVTSTAGLTGEGSSVPYCASKAALINMTTALARVLAPSIRVNSVAPGFVDSEWTRQGLGAAFEAAAAAHQKRSVLGRVLRPEDIAAAIVSIIRGSDMVTGQNFVVDGGFLISTRL